MTNTTERSLAHSTFTVERDFASPPHAVFQAFADKAIKQKWFAGPDPWHQLSVGFDFREGGREHNEGQFGDEGPISRFDCYYHEIVPDTRIVYDYEMRVDGLRLSVSLASVEFAASGSGTHLTLTEFGVYFDAAEDPALREAGTRELMDALVAVVDGPAHPVRSGGDPGISADHWVQRKM
jgi:uncharacterized protein YndB with AHSA1/START domain